MVATSRAVWLASHGYSTVEPYKDRNIARSSRPIWDGPSCPIATPACEPTRLIPEPLIDAMRTKSWARVRNAANVEAYGTQPRVAMPTAVATSCCSAM